MALSTLRKYQLITGEDLMKSTTNLQKMVEGEDFSNYTDTAEPIYHALCLARDYPDINEAKRVFNEAKASKDLGNYEFSTEGLAEMIQDAF